MCSDGPTTHWRSWSSRTSRSDHHQVHRLDGNRRHQISSLITIKNKHNELIVVNVQSLLLSQDWAEHYISTKHKFYPTCIYLYRKTNWRWFHWLLVASSLWCNTDISFSINTMLKWIQSVQWRLSFYLSVWRRRGWLSGWSQRVVPQLVTEDQLLLNRSWTLL